MSPPGAVAGAHGLGMLSLGRHYSTGAAVAVGGGHISNINNNSCNAARRSATHLMYDRVREKSERAGSVAARTPLHLHGEATVPCASS